MSKQKDGRALRWAGAGGGALAMITMAAAVVVGSTPDWTEAASRTGPFRAKAAAAGHVPAGRAPESRPRPVPPTSPATTLPVPSTSEAPTPPATTPAVPVTDPPAATTAAGPWTTALPTMRLAAPIIGGASVASGRELVLAAADGGVFPVGQAGFYGSLGGQPLAGQVAAVASDPATGGYWLAGRDGGVFAFNAGYLGSAGSIRVNAPVAAMAATPTGSGYWLASRDGGVFAFGDAVYAGSLSGVVLRAPVVAMAATPTGSGLLAGVFRWWGVRVR